MIIKILKNISFNGLLSSFSFIITGGLLTVYFWGKLTNNNHLIEIFNFQTNNGVFWILIIFIALCNVNYFDSIIKSIVGDKFDGIVSENLDSRILNQATKYIKNNPDKIKLAQYESSERKSEFQKNIPNIK